MTTLLLPCNLSIRHLMRKYRMKTLDFLKIDIEGAEGALFATGGRPEEWMPLLTGCFSIEIHVGPGRALPDTWEADVLSPLLVRFGFEKQSLNAGELKVYCR